MSNVKGRGSLGRTVRLGVSTAVIATMLVGPAWAQTQGATQGASQEATATPDAKDVVITGVRGALQSARARKKNADTVIDSISATDIGAFPDKSVAEALQRVPGITVSRFAINTDTAHFTTEPSGVLVRGLPQVRSEFNGRDSFSASGGRALSWGDVPVELLGGVDVYKNQTADLIEGGIAGSVNLRTRLPFDSNQQLILIGARANYGDIGKKVTPDANVFYSNRWQTGIGEFGFMGDVAYSQVKTGSQGLQSYRAGIFTGGMIPGSANAESVFGKGTVVIPSSLSYLDDRFDRKRSGVTAAAQWRSNDHKWLATAQYIRSDYKNSMNEHGIGVGLFSFPGSPAATFRFTPTDDNAHPAPAPGTPDFTFDQSGFMDHGTFDTVNGVWWGGDAGTALNSNGQPMLHSCTNHNMGWGTYNSSDLNQTPGYCPAGLNHNADTFSTNSRIQQSHSMTQDMSLNLKWDPSSVLHFSFDGQYIDSTAKYYDAGVSFGSYTNPELSGLGTKPRIVALHPGSNVFLSPGGYANPDNYTVSSLADQNQDNRGHEWAFRADGQWDVPGGGWIDTIKFGARYSDRDQVVQGSAYNWNNIGNNWTRGCQYIYYNLDKGPGTCTDGGNTTTFNGYPKGSYDVEKFGASFFGGSLGSFPFMPFSFLNSHGLDQFAQEKLGSVKDANGNVVGHIGSGFEPICQRLGQPGMNSGSHVVLPGSCFAPDEIANISETTKAVYLMAKFGGNDNIHIGGVRVSGNIGLRFVETKDKSNGYLVFPSIFSSQDPTAVCPPTPLVPGGLTGTGTGSGQAGQVAFPAICFLTPDDQKFAAGAGTAVPQSASTTHRNLLPSFNLRFDFSPSWLLRLAASKAMSRPDIGLLKNYVSISQILPGNNTSDPGWVKDAQGNIVGVQPKYQATATNPYLKSATAWQFDVSLEHYFGNAGMFSADVFYKTFQNYIQSGLFNANFVNNGVTRVVQVSGPANGKGAKIYGFEVAYNRFFDFLPKPFDGLGMQTNFTYLKNKGVPNSNLSTFFPIAGGISVPALNPGSLEGLSKYSFNVVALYEKPGLPVSFRMAYNWRSKYLVTASDCCVGLPVWQAGTGYLDGSIRYSINDHLEMSLEGSNLLNTQTKTLQQLTDNTSPEGKRILVHNSWFRQDRRFTLGARWKM